MGHMGRQHIMLENVLIIVIVFHLIIYLILLIVLC